MSADGSQPAPHHASARARYSTPVWSPRGDLIAFTRQSGGQFAIGVMKPDGSGERILTEGFHNEGPTWAPNGRVLMFFRDTPGANGGPQLWTIDLTGYNEFRCRRRPSPPTRPGRPCSTEPRPASVRAVGWGARRQVFAGRLTYGRATASRPGNFLNHVPDGRLTTALLDHGLAGMVDEELSEWRNLLTIPRSARLIVALGAALMLAACANDPERAGAGLGRRHRRRRPPPGSAQDFVVNVGDRVFFETDSTDLTPHGARHARPAGAVAQAVLARYAFTVEGHADERGTREYNIALGARRAAAVRDYLVSRGIAANRMHTISYGKERPVAVCDDISCWSQNRRAVTVHQQRPASEPRNRRRSLAISAGSLKRGKSATTVPNGGLVPPFLCWRPTLAVC